MTQLNSEKDGYAAAKLASASTAQNDRLNYDGVYLCPVCRHGHIAALTLMDAFACSFCGHIFTANLQEQSLQVVDSSQPMAWRWNGRTWRLAYQDDLNLTFVIWAVGAALAILPPVLVWLSAHTFPPLPGSTGSWLPLVWIGLTFSLHLTLVLWLVAEHYQFPAYVSAKVQLRQLMGRG
ncbi:MAG: DUF2396 family protein [Cyanothece sp. SIO1E1]|nr:DUF2396 family protein [Cyanothece sp. SIO1E1]